MEDLRIGSDGGVCEYLYKMHDCWVGTSRVFAEKGYIPPLTCDSSRRSCPSFALCLPFFLPHGLFDRTALHVDRISTV